MTPNQKAFLDAIAYSELGAGLLAASDNGYNVLVGSTAEHPVLFTSYADHPRKLVQLGHGLASTAAGRYQVLAKYYDFYKSQLELPDFSPASQDAVALGYLKDYGALPDVAAGRFDRAVMKCSRVWASFPSAGYGQHENSLDKLRVAYVAAGGVLA